MHKSLSMKARTTLKTDSRKKISSVTPRQTNEEPSEIMMLEGWLTKRIAPEVFSRFEQLVNFSFFFV
jgi:hypothetical protein